ncbi:MAG: N5-carboxyaminoimidazole ribonucleotide synthase [Gemmatimonadaceae bacterium]|nr:N5-carboxyaminoimidazole ribonucleotide synthase [Gemmatimonadaceae bacterium]
MTLTAVLPGGSATIGLLGGGQLGRMTGMAARSLGYDVQVLDPDPQCPARAIASRTITARFDDADAAVRLARECDVVTLEIEQIAPPVLAAVARETRLCPNAEAVIVVQDRIRQRTWLDRHGFPIGAFRIARSAAECAAAVIAMDRCILKAPHGGYDGRGQVRVATTGEAERGWESLGSRPVVVEQFLDLELELSVMIARRADGEARAFPPAVNHHEQGVLDWSVCPGQLPPAVGDEAVRIGHAIADALDIVGVIAIELFLVRDGRLLVNELAPRPHNTYHHTERGCSTSQFEQFVRAICGLPLGSVNVVRPAAIANLLGDLWREGEQLDFGRALAVPEVRLHLYGKTSARPGRKMGHLSALGGTTEEARQRVLEARRLLAR